MTPTSNTEPAPTPVTAPAKSPKRRRSWLPWVLVLGFAALLLSLPFAFNYYSAWSSERELEAIYAELDAEDPNWRWPDLLKENADLPDDQNAIVVVERIHTLLKAKPFSPAATWDSEANQKSLNVRNSRLVAENADVMRAALDRLDPEALALARKLKDMPRGRLKLDPEANPYELSLDPIQRSRDVTRLLYGDAILLAHDGKMDEACDSCRAMFNLGHAVGQNPTVIAQLVRMAFKGIASGVLERVLGQGECSEPTMAQLQVALQRDLDDKALHRGFRGERAVTHQFYLQMREGKATMTGTFSKWKPQPSFEDRLFDTFPGLFFSHYPEHLRMMNEQVRIANLPDEQSTPALYAFDKKIRTTPNRVTRMMMPAFLKVGDANQRTLAQCRCALVAVAAERYRLKQGAWPRSADELVKAGLLPAIQNDPYDGKPLRFKATPTGILVYSVGPDKTDDGGKLNRANPMAPSIDYGFELWDRPLRRAPPFVDDER